MNKKFNLFFIFLVLFSINIVIATTVNVGVIKTEDTSSQTFKQNSNINLNTQCLFNGSYCPVSSVCNVSVNYPNSSWMLNSIPMTNQYSFFNYTLKDSSVIGRYDCLTVCCSNSDICGSSNCDFEITPTGTIPNFNFFWIILLVSAGIVACGFFIKDPWVTILGTFGLYFLGLYIVINGIVGVKDMVTTWAIGIILLSIAAYISVFSAIEVVEDNM